MLNVENTRETLDEQPPVQPFTLEELWTRLNKMPNNKACGPDGVPVEAIRLLMQYGEDLVLQTMNEALINGMPYMWRTSIITPTFKEKGSAMECSNYRGIKLLCHAMKLYERMVENKLRKQIEISSNQYGFRPGKSSMETIFALRILQEKYLEKRKELHMVFVDPEKAYDRIPRDRIWWSPRKRGLEEHYITVISDMYERSKTKVRTLTGSTKEFQIDVGLHQGSALSPFLCIVILDELIESIGIDPPNAMLFADDLVICEDTRDTAEYQLERWRYVFRHVNPPSFVRRLRHFGIAENLRPGDENLRHLTVTSI